jgi:hypothetical protein
MDQKSIQVGFILHLDFIFDSIIFLGSFMGLWCNCLPTKILSRFHNNILVKKGIYSINISHIFIGDVQIPPILVTKVL